MTRLNIWKEARQLCSLHRVEKGMPLEISQSLFSRFIFVLEWNGRENEPKRKSLQQGAGTAFTIYVSEECVLLLAKLAGLDKESTGFHSRLLLWLAFWFTQIWGCLGNKPVMCYYSHVNMCQLFSTHWFSSSNSLKMWISVSKTFTAVILKCMRWIKFDPESYTQLNKWSEMSLLLLRSQIMISPDLSIFPVLIITHIKSENELCDLELATYFFTLLVNLTAYAQGKGKGHRPHW